MSNITTNQLRPENWNDRRIEDEFDIYHISMDRHTDRNILNIQDERLKIVSTVYISGQSIFILTKKNGTSEDVLQYLLSTKGQKVYVRKESLELLTKRPLEMRRIFGYRNRALVQLLINSTLNTPLFPEDEYNNITGRCYYFNSEWNEDTSKRIELIDFTIGQDMSLYPSVVTFTKERPEKDFPEKVVYDRVRNVIRKPIGKESADSVYYRHGQEGTHSSRAFDGTTLSYWESSRMSCMAKFFIAVQQELEEYVHLGFVKADGEKVVARTIDDGTNKIPEILRKDGICLVDNIVLSTKEQSDEKKMEKLRDWISESRQAVIDAIMAYCSINNIDVRKGAKDLYSLNLELVRPELFYKCNKTVKDPYVSDDGLTCQHFTIPCSTKGKGFTEAINVVLKELAIKSDLREGKIRITDWSSEKPLSFFIAVPLDRTKVSRPVHFKGMTIQPDGSFVTEQFSVDILQSMSLSELRKRRIVRMFFSNNFGRDYYDRNIEMVMFPPDSLQDALKIRRTNIRVMSDLKAMKEAFEGERMDVIFDTDTIMSAIEPFQWDKSDVVREVYYKILNGIYGQGEISKSELFPLLYPDKKDGQKKTMICRRIKETIENVTGAILRVSRSDDTEEELGTSLYRHIHTWPSQEYDQESVDEEPPIVYNYTVGQFDKPNQSIATSPVVRQISRLDGQKPSEDELLTLIRMMQVGFVRFKNYTVLPFPAKYLRELLNTFD